MAKTVRLDWENSDFAVFLEDDDRVVVAYLLKGDSVVGDVWLFNRGQTPTLSEWHDHKNGPFKNAAKFVSRSVMAPDIYSIAAQWIRDDHDLFFVELRADGNLLAALSPVSKPGWCANAAMNGPVAKTLDDYIAHRKHDVS